MIVHEIHSGAVTVTFTREELELLGNALNEVAHALQDWEYSTRIGAQREEAKQLLKVILSAREEMDRSG